MQSIWEQQSFYAPSDVLIVGAGLMGLWTALELKRRNEALRITILERHTTPLGASTRNAGFACFGSPTELIHDALQSGADAMLEVVEMRYKGISKIRAHFPDSQTGFDACGGYECINRDYARWSELDDRLHWLNGLLKEICGDTSLFTDATDRIPALGLRGFDRLVANRSEAALHSGRLVQSLTQKVQATGVTILYGTEVTGWERATQGVNVHVNNMEMSTGTLLLCTNAFTQQLAPSLSVKPARGQVIVTSPIDGLPLKGTFHYDEGYYYWRNLGNRILLGGARNTAFGEEETTDLAGSEQIRKALEIFLQKHIDPSFSYTIEHHWSGVMGFTENKAPLVQQIDRNVIAAIACNGIGVALTPVMAERVADTVL